MTTLAQATAAVGEVPLGGQTWRMSPLTDQDIAELDLWLRGRVIQIARQSLTPDMGATDREETMRAAFAYASSLSWLNQAHRELATVDGLARFLWQTLHRQHPDVTVDKIRSMIIGDPTAVLNAMDMFDLLNGTGRASKKVQPAAGRKPARKRKPARGGK